MSEFDIIDSCCNVLSVLGVMKQANLYPIISKPAVADGLPLH